MKKILISLFFCISIVSSKDEAETENTKEKIKKVLDEKLAPEENAAPHQEKKVFTFAFKDTPLVVALNQISALKNINIVLPQGSQEITLKLNWSIQGTTDQIWQRTNTILSLAGYTLLPERNGQMQLVKIDKDSTKREPVALYINPPLDQLPSSSVIKAIFYLTNLKLTENDPAITKILKGGGPGQDGMLSAAADLKIISGQNALMITDRADNIYSAMKIILALDVSGIPDAIEVIPLYYSTASYVEDLFKLLIRPITGQAPTVGQERARASYFPEDTKVVAINRTNSIVIMGTSRSILTVKDFILKYIDLPLEAGRSVLHIYDLQYLDAEDFAPKLQQLVSGGSMATGQSQTQAAGGGIRQEFRNVIIVAEPTRQSTAVIQPTEGGGGGETSVTPETEGVQQGGNRLVIAAQWNDWVRIRDLIGKLDKPQPSVVLEVLVVDLVLSDDKLLGSQIRNQSGFNDSFNNNINFQSAQLDNVVLQNPLPQTNLNITNPNPNFVNLPANALMANLLQFAQNATTNLADSSTPGTTVIAISDPNGSGIWNVWRILNQYTNATMLTQPFITTLDNQEATIVLSTQRFLPGGAAAESGAVDLKSEYVNADISIDLLPHISLRNNNINLNIIIHVDEYSSDANNTRITRLVQTNANVGDREVLAIGGLVSQQDTITLRKTPLLGDIPILGWFFKEQEVVRQKNNLLVFIEPTIIKTQKYNGMGKFTQEKMCKAELEIEGSINFQSLRDPITRWFFQPDVGYAKHVTQDYIAESTRYIQPYRAPTPDQDRVPAYNQNIFTLQQQVDDEKDEQQKSDELKKKLAHQQNPLNGHHQVE